MNSGALVSLRCPDCAKSLGRPEGRPTCPGCARAFAPTEGVWDLLPHALDDVRTHEDEAHAEEVRLPTWQRLFFHKRYWLECQGRWLPDLVDGRTRSFLEIGVSSARRRGCPASRASESRALDRRTRKQGTRERAIRYREWLAILKEAGMGAECLAPVPGERVRAPWLRRLGNGARQIYVAIRLTR